MGEYAPSAPTRGDDAQRRRVFPCGHAYTDSELFEALDRGDREREVFDEGQDGQEGSTASTPPHSLFQTFTRVMATSALIALPSTVAFLLLGTLALLLSRSSQA